MNLCVIDDADAKRQQGHGNLLLLLVLCEMASNIVDMVRSIILLLHRRGRLLGLCIVVAMFYNCLYCFCSNVGYLSAAPQPDNLLLFSN